MRVGLKTSIILHICLFIILFVGLPVFTPDRSYEDQVVTVEILPVSEITNVKQKKFTPKPVKKEKVITKNAPKISKPKPQKPKPEEKVKVEPLPKHVVKKPEKKEAVKIKKEEPKPVEKKEEPKKEEANPEIAEDAFASVLKSVEEFKEKDEDKKEDDTEKTDFSDVEDLLAKADTPQYKEGLPLSLNEKDAIRQQIMKNWTVPAGAKDIQNTVVSLHIKLQPDGTVTKVSINDEMRYNSDPFFRAMTDSAIRAVYKSSPLQNLPPEKYDVRDGWREIEMNFDPREMVY